MCSFCFCSIYHALGIEDDAGNSSIVNPYKVLGLANDASLKDIKSAYRLASCKRIFKLKLRIYIIYIYVIYRKQSLLYHPDRTGNDPIRTAKFLEYRDAYKALTDPEQVGNAAARVPPEPGKAFSRTWTITNSCCIN